MKITVELSELAAESSYLTLKKSLPKLTQKELDAGTKESGIAPLCQQNLDERLFMLGLQIMIREITNPGDTIASSIAKAADLTTVHAFLGQLDKERIAISRRIHELHEKVLAGKSNAEEVHLKFADFRKTIGDDAFNMWMGHERLSGLEIAMVALSRAMNEEPKPKKQKGKKQ